ncbi:MAG: hypothetical protein CVU04_03905 [Bacteroidetes bacterium HGW-Bacteroidetes-20]|nr:MAG: hypothetical protein CVU04_03905 [Bacteroidetes bacterium HGW-Bacteroidetes-20]
MTDFYCGKVINGNKKGREFGFPTVNILLEENSQLTDTGVFASEIVINNVVYKGMLYIGKRPTLGFHKLSIEINIFDFDLEIYGSKICFKILQKIRPDIAFESIDLLIKQIHADKLEIENFFAHR